MVDLAQKLMVAAQQQLRTRSLRMESKQILATPQKSLSRVGMWPIVSKAEPELALGIGLTLAALLEQHPSVSVYRLLSRVNRVDLSSTWSIKDSQFDVDDWEPEGLDENAAIWGELVRQDDRYKLALHVEDDARSENELLNISYEGSLAELLNQLIDCSAQIIQWLISDSHISAYKYSPIVSSDSARLEEFLEAIFRWENDYYLELTGSVHESEMVLQIQTKLIQLAGQIGSNFGAWLLSITISRYVSSDIVAWDQILLPNIGRVVYQLQFPIASLILAKTLAQLKFDLQAFDMLETSLESHAESTELWSALGELYSQFGQVLSAIDVYQRAIEIDVVTGEMYEKYALLINLLDERQIELKPNSKRVSASGRPFIERYLFANNTSKARNLYESCYSLRRAVEQDASNHDALALLVTNMILLKDPDLWNYCEMLVERDQDGISTAAVIDHIDEIHLQKMVEILKRVKSKRSDDPNLQLNLVKGYIALGDLLQAKATLSDLESRNQPLVIKSNMARLRLSIDDQGFDEKLWELRDILDAKGQVEISFADFLEEAIEREPIFIEGYRLLAEVYLSWGETEDALEVLLDAQATSLFDATIVALLAKVLWNLNEINLTFTTLEKGLSVEPTNATLLSLMGKFVFENGDDDGAKEYMLKAETIDPLNPELNAVRSYIANEVMKSKADK